MECSKSMAFVALRSYEGLCFCSDKGRRVRWKSEISKKVEPSWLPLGDTRLKLRTQEHCLVDCSA